MMDNTTDSDIAGVIKKIMAKPRDMFYFYFLKDYRSELLDAHIHFPENRTETLIELQMMETILSEDITSVNYRDAYFDLALRKNNYESIFGSKIFQSDEEIQEYYNWLRKEIKPKFWEEIYAKR